MDRNSVHNPQPGDTFMVNEGDNHLTYYKVNEVTPLYIAAHGHCTICDTHDGIAEWTEEEFSWSEWNEYIVDNGGTLV